ncbi:PREDICTED: uncharacterized protein LOC104819768 [Tarenaya hassleriana]|uniref:uncharacterized protein LOC104819768 n=1 Tax=Tarenaya hassleriana TaxID=28532 RepID=UPI00053C80AA|nr:PREDICTED: uncharacterized protein LOC104819768 [Tarenaya hassleriana]
MAENPKNPRHWRYTWVAQSHSPNLRLFLFDSGTSPRLHCKSLSVSLILEQSQLLITWVDDVDDRDEAKERDEVSLRVPVPRILIDAESPVNFRALDDHIEVKLVLLLPVDHPIVDSVLYSLGDTKDSAFESAGPLVMDSDVKLLSLMGKVDFYCRNCSNRLTREGLRNFSEMPSVNWREAADNWFGNCCCTFGGISEMMVAKYANSYSCSSGLCLLSATTVLLSKDDLEEGILSEINSIQEEELGSNLTFSVDLGKVERDSRRNQENSVCPENQCESELGIVCGQVDNTEPSRKADHGETYHCDIHLVDKASMPECCVLGSNDSCERFQLEQTITNATDLTPEKKFLLDGFLEDVFMARASNVSRNVKWIEFGCSKCSSLLGVYPSSSNSLIDGGVRFFKCYISTSSPVGGPADAFRKYTLDRMFTNQLVEYAKDELSFQVVVKDLTNKLPLFQIVILNPNTWCSTGLCSSDEDATADTCSRGELRPVVKVLFSDCGNSPDPHNRVMGKKKNIMDEVFILKKQGEKLMDLLNTANKFLPPSCSYLQGSPISSMWL